MIIANHTANRTIAANLAQIVAILHSSTVFAYHATNVLLTVDCAGVIASRYGAMIATSHTPQPGGVIAAGNRAAVIAVRHGAVVSANHTADA